MQSFYTSLDYQELLEVSGEDSEKFLQGQLTCDVDKLANGQYGLGALCNNKGRVYASFRLLKLDHEFLMALQPGLLEVTQKNLQKYIPFYKATMSDAGSRFARTGLAGPLALEFLQSRFPALPEANQSLVTNGTRVLNVGGTTPRFEVWADPGQDNLIRDTGTLQQASPEAWQALDIETGIFMTNIQDVELYTPEEANLDLAGFISFDKGCYTGQEIVARMHYRGKAGKRLFKVSVETAQEIPGGRLITTSGDTLGIVTNLLYLNNKAIGFTVLKTAVDLAQPILLENGPSSIPAQVSPLLYP